MDEGCLLDWDAGMEETVNDKDTLYGNSVCSTQPCYEPKTALKETINNDPSFEAHIFLEGIPRHSLFIHHFIFCNPNTCSVPCDLRENKHKF